MLVLLLLLLLLLLFKYIIFKLCYYNQLNAQCQYVIFTKTLHVQHVSTFHISSETSFINQLSTKHEVQ